MDFADQISSQLPPDVAVQRVVVTATLLANGRVIVDARGEDLHDDANGWEMKANLTPSMVEAIMEQFSG